MYFHKISKHNQRTKEPKNQISEPKILYFYQQQPGVQKTMFFFKIKKVVFLFFLVLLFFLGFLFFNLKKGKNAICIYCILQCIYKHKIVIIIIMPLLKNKTENISDVNNYRAIALSNSISKLLEDVLLNILKQL